jgi:D-3-phosphoglycerate dehydrogenase
MNKRCLIIDPAHESLFLMLKEIGWEAIYKPSMTREEIRAELHDYTGLIVRSKTKIDRDLLGENPTIKFIGRAGAGLDNIDLKYVEEKKIQLIHAAEGNRDAVGEHTVGLLLSLLRNIVRADQEIRSYSWKREENRGMEIMGKTVAIIGYGNMGSAFAKRLSGFECKVLAYDKYKVGFSDNYCHEATMQQIFEEADIVSFHIPLTDETKSLVTVDYLNKFGKNIIVVNTSRGEIISLSDLQICLKNRKVIGAALDVLENEKLNELTDIQRASFNYLVEQANVIFSPHIAGWTFESHYKINVALKEKLARLNFSE